MQQYDPYFAFADLEVEAGDIFREFYCNFLAGNLDYLQTVSGGVALAGCKGELQRRKKEGWINRYDEFLDCGDAVFNSGQMDQQPSFTFIIDCTEIDCKVSTKDPEEITEGSDESITKISWRFTLSRHDDPDIEVTGHYWEITEFQKVGELKMLV